MTTQQVEQVECVSLIGDVKAQMAANKKWVEGVEHPVLILFDLNQTLWVRELKKLKGCTHAFKTGGKKSRFVYVRPNAVHMLARLVSNRRVVVGCMTSMAVRNSETALSRLLSVVAQHDACEVTEEDIRSRFLLFCQEYFHTNCADFYKGCKGTELGDRFVAVYNATNERPMEHQCVRNLEAVLDSVQVSHLGLTMDDLVLVENDPFKVVHVDPTNVILVNSWDDKRVLDHQEAVDGGSELDRTLFDLEEYLTALVDSDSSLTLAQARAQLEWVTPDDVFSLTSAVDDELAEDVHSGRDKDAQEEAELAAKLGNVQLE